MTRQLLQRLLARGLSALTLCFLAWTLYVLFFVGYESSEAETGKASTILFLVPLDRDSMERGSHQLTGALEALKEFNGKPGSPYHMEAAMLQLSNEEAIKSIKLRDKTILILGPDTSRDADKVYNVDPNKWLMDRKWLTTSKAPILLTSVTGDKVREQLKEKLGSRIGFAIGSNNDIANELSKKIKGYVDELAKPTGCKGVALWSHQSDKGYAQDLVGQIKKSMANLPEEHQKRSCPGPSPDTFCDAKCADKPPFCVWVIIGNYASYKEQPPCPIQAKKIILSDGLSDGLTDEDIKKLNPNAAGGVALKPCSVKAGNDRERVAAVRKEGRQFWSVVAEEAVKRFLEARNKCIEDRGPDTTGTCEPELSTEQCCGWLALRIFEKEKEKDNENKEESKEENKEESKEEKGPIPFWIDCNGDH